VPGFTKKIHSTFLNHRLSCHLRYYTQNLASGSRSAKWSRLEIHTQSSKCRRSKNSGGVLGEEYKKAIKRQLDSLGGGVLGEDYKRAIKRQLDSLGGGVLGDEEMKRSVSSDSVESAVENLMRALAKQYHKKEFTWA